jgi:hypothetical protein
MGLMGPMKSKPHFMNSLANIMLINFAIGVCKRFLVCWQESQDWQWHTPKLLDGLNYESKRWKQQKDKELGMLLSSQHFEGRGAC